MKKMNRKIISCLFLVGLIIFLQEKDIHAYCPEIRYDVNFKVPDPSQTCVEILAHVCGEAVIITNRCKESASIGPFKNCQIIRTYSKEEDAKFSSFFHEGFLNIVRDRRLDITRPENNKITIFYYYWIFTCESDLIGQDRFKFQVNEPDGDYYNIDVEYKLRDSEESETQGDNP